MKAEMTKRLNGLTDISVLREEESALDEKKLAKMSGNLTHTQYSFNVLLVST
jgi:hypothetical protein